MSAGFVDALAGATPARRTLVNARTGRPVATDVAAALTRRSRRRGLLGRDTLPPSAALVIAPCFAIHTAFMRFPIDAIFVDRGGCVLRVVSRLVPWRVAIAGGASAVIEMAAGSIQPADLAVGDRLYVSS